MTEADNYDTTTASGLDRRGLLGRSAAALLADAAIALTVRTGAPTPAVANGEDAELIRLCAALALQAEVVDRHCASPYPAFPGGVEDRMTAEGRPLP